MPLSLFLKIKKAKAVTVTWTRIALILKDAWETNKGGGGGDHKKEP